MLLLTWAIIGRSYLTIVDFISLLCLKETLQDVKKHVVARGTFRESRKPCRYQAYVVAMSNMIQVEPSTFEEFIKEQVCKDVIAKEYEYEK